MRKYTVLAVLTLQPGTVVSLTPAQADARKHALRVPDKAPKGVYEVISPVQFKVGEEIATDAELNKVLATQLESTDTAKQKAKAKAQSEADAKDQAALAEKAQAWDKVQAELPELREKAASWDKVQEELLAHRQFVNSLEQLPKELLDQVKASLDQQSAPAAKK